MTSEEFLFIYRQAMKDAQGIVGQHTDDGENQVVSIEQMFPHGSQDANFILFQKISRILGYEKAGNAKKVLEEAYDIINYGAFLVALLIAEANSGKPKK